MALDKASLKARIENELVNLGADKNNEHSWVSKLATALSNAVVDEIQANAKVTVPTHGDCPVN